MKSSQEIIKKANIVPRLRLGNKTDHGVVANGPHRVKFIQDKEAKGTDIHGKEIDVVAYLVEESGQKKSYRVPKFGKDGQIHYLVQRLAEIEENEEVILEMKKKGIKNYIDVTPLKSSSSIEVDDGIPIINEDESTNNETNLPVESEEQESER